MKPLTCFVTLSLFVMLFFNCSREQHPLEASSESVFAIHFLQNADLHYTDIADKPIKSLTITKTPVVTEKDIEYYKIFNVTNKTPKTHAIKFNKDVESAFGNTDRFFVLVVNGERQYVGEYWSSFKNSVPSEILMYSYSIAENEFHILTSEDGDKKINNEKILNALTNAGIEIKYQNE